MMRVDDIMVDPERFQFRVAAWASGGTDDRLSGCRIFNANLAGVLAVWRDPVDGKTYLCDGHHRLKLARRDGVSAVAVQFLKAGSDIEARSWAALKNIAEGHATATDAARWLVDTGSDAEALAGWGLNVRSALVVKALALKTLPAVLLSAVCTGELPEDYGLAIAEAGDPQVMIDLWRLAQERSWSLDQVSEAAALAQGCKVTAAEVVGCLPGLEALLSTSQSDLSERLAISAAIRRSLKTELRSLRVVSARGSAQMLEGKNIAVVDPVAAQAGRAEAGAMLEAFSRLAMAAGPLADLIGELAANLATTGGDPIAMARQHQGRIRAVLSV